jgi:AraC family transcriptional regulator
MLQPIHWDIPLEMPPTIFQMGVGIHGSMPVENYQLAGLWCLHLYRYVADLYLDDVRFEIRPHHISVIPPGTRMRYHFFGRSIHLYAHFAFPQQGASIVSIPAVQDLGIRFDPLYQSIEQAIGYFPTQPRRAEVRLWDILWQLTLPSDSEARRPNHIHPDVQQVINLVELRMGQPLRVSDIVHEVGKSQNHLTRLFTAAMGITIGAYIQQRRVQRAQHLLLHSSLPVKTIAREVGIADLHLFNKTVRRVLGVSPRQVREFREKE